MAIVQGLVPFTSAHVQCPSSFSWCNRGRSCTSSRSCRSVWCIRAGRRYVPPGPLSGRKVITEELWLDFFSDPSQWWDHRLEKADRGHPDFKHKKTRQSLWLDNYMNPTWVEARLAALTPGTLQSHIFSWNVKLQRYVNDGDYQKAMELFQQMQGEVMIPDKFTYVSVLNACSGLESLENGRRVHEQIIKRGYESDAFVGNALVDMYAKCGSIEDAERLFRNMHSPDVVSWSAMIVGFVKCGQGEKALALYRQMEQKGVDPNSVTFVGVLNACASLAANEKGRRVHEQVIERGYGSDVFVCSSLVDMYAKCGSIEDARRVFDEMPSRNIVSWNAMLAGYAMHGRAKEALEHFERMCEEDIVVDGVSFVCLLSACSHGGLVGKGLYYFESMSKDYNISPTQDHYACIIDLLGRAGHLHKAENLIRNMPFKPHAAIWRSLLGACRLHKNVKMGERVTKRLLELEPESASAYVLLSNIYSAAGRMDSAAILYQQRMAKGGE